MITVPSNIFRFSPGVAGSILDSTERFEMLAASLLWRSRHSPAKSWSRAWKKMPWIRALCSQTLEPSTEPAFVAWWTQSLAAARVRDSRWPADDLDSYVTPVVDSSSRWFGSSRSHDRSSSSGKMSWGPKNTSPRSSRSSNESVFEGKEPSFELLTWEPPTNVPESSSSLDEWRTPTSRDGDSGPGVSESRPSPQNLRTQVQWMTLQSRDFHGPSGRSYSGGPLDLPAQATWQTPRATDGSNGGPNQMLHGKPALTNQARSFGSRVPAVSSSSVLSPPSAPDVEKSEAGPPMWPTPATSRYGSNQGGGAGRVGPVRPSLDSLAKLWPTTTTSDAKASGAQGYSSAGHHAGTTLTDAAVRNWSTPRAEERQQYNSVDNGEALSRQTKSWPTPASRDCKGANGPEHLAKERGHHDQLPNAVVLSGLQAPTETGQESPPTSTRLNPAFVEWLMGWEEGWSLPWPRKQSGQTDSGCWETVWSRPKQKQLSDFSTQQSVPPDHLDQGQSYERTEAMAKTRDELLKQIANATPSGGGNNCRDGRYRFAVRKLGLDAGFKGARFDMDLVVVGCQKIPGLVELKTGKAIDVEPNAIGTDVGIVKMLESKEPYEPPGFGDTKAFVLALYGVNESETTSDEIIQLIDDLDKTNCAYGMVIDCVTRRKISEKNKVEMVLQDWFHVQQTPEDIVKTRAWLESLLNIATAAKPAAATAPTFGPPPPAKA